MRNESFIPDVANKVISNDRIAFFRAARSNKRPDIDSNKLISDFSPAGNFQSPAFQRYSDEIEDPPKGTPLPLTDPRVEKLRNEWKYCPIMQKQFDYKCCIYLGLFRLKLQRILHSIPFHIIVSLLVIIDVLIVILELTVETRQLAHCRSEEDCLDKCNNTQTHTQPQNYTELKNETEHLICGFVGLTHRCVLESEATPDVSRILSIMTITILSIFVLEVLIKLFAFGFGLFKKCFEVFDAIVILISFIIDVVHFFFEENELVILFELLIILRLWRIVRIITASIAAYNAVKEEEEEKKTKMKFDEEAKHYLSLIKEYECARCEIIRVRELLVAKREDPFPPEYRLTREEADYFHVSFHAF